MENACGDVTSRVYGYCDLCQVACTLDTGYIQIKREVYRHSSCEWERWKREHGYG